MDDLSNKLSEILSDQSAMQQIKELSEMLMSQNSGGAAVHSEPAAKSTLPDMGLGLSGDMLKIVSKLAPLASDMNKEDDTTRLLFALRPFLSSQRQKKLDEACKLLKMMKLLPLLKDLSVFDSLF